MGAFEQDYKNECIIFTYENEEGEEVTVNLPAIFEVCYTCEGRGKHDHPAFSNGITMDEWNGPDWDDESRETYLSGGYDVPCEECHGRRVVLVIDEQRVKPEILALVEEQRQLEAKWAREEASNRRWGY